ncbi:MAG: hypothetical protein MZU97_13235 [Bacillus subtilis]|nr:hypothetical protein [Bacillus subtilis]
MSSKRQDSNPDDIIKNGNVFTAANGLFGYRGTLEEYRADDLVQLTMGGVYSRRKDGFEEPVAFFNPLYTYLKIGGQILHPRRNPPEKHLQTLDMANGRHFRGNPVHRRRCRRDDPGRTLPARAGSLASSCSAIGSPSPRRSTSNSSPASTPRSPTAAVPISTIPASPSKTTSRRRWRLCSTPAA